MPETIRLESDLAAARELLAWRFGDMCYGLGLTDVDELISRESWDSLEPAQVRALLPTPSGGADAAIVPGLRAERQKLFVDAQHGLGNRLRAIGSAAAVAQAEDRELVIVWRPDHHCECLFGDLFDYDGPVLDSMCPLDAASAGATIVNYMETESGSAKDAPVACERGTDLYFRSAYLMNHPASRWQTENEFIRRLTPVAPVLDLMASTRTANDVGAHIRMAGGPAYEHLDWESPANWTDEAHEAIAHWRAQSHYDRFAARIRTLLESGGAETVFVAADLPETYEVFEAMFPGRIAHLPRSVNDRSGNQLRFALADALLLSKTPLLLASTWSSFSELAMRLAEPGQKVERTAHDF